jgi:hypothetical protein
MIQGLIGALAGAVAVFAGFLIFQPAAIPPLGGSGIDEYTFKQFHDNMLVGGGVFATSSQGATTYTAASIVNSRVIFHAAESTLTATLPTNAALSAAGFLPNVGDTQTLYIYASTTLITIAGNTEVRLDSASTTNIVNAGGVGRLDFIRLPATENRGIEVHLTTGE